MNTLQTQIYPLDPTAYGGELRKTRKGRMGPRGLNFSNTMHLVLRSTQAKGDWSFTKKRNKTKIDQIINKFSKSYSVQILSMAYVGNHLHFHIKLLTRRSYCKFIKSITSAIVMAVTRVNKFKKLTKAFWDLRPYTRIIFGERGRKIIERYIQINQLEGLGHCRDEAKFLIQEEVNRRKRREIAKEAYFLK